MSTQNPLAIDWTKFVQARRDGTPIPEQILEYFDGLVARLQAAQRETIGRSDREAIKILGLPPRGRGKRILRTENLDDREWWETHNIAHLVLRGIMSGKTLTRSRAQVAQRLGVSPSTVRLAWLAWEKNDRDVEPLSRIVAIRRTNRKTGVTITEVSPQMDDLLARHGLGQVEVDVKSLIVRNRDNARKRARR